MIPVTYDDLQNDFEIEQQPSRTYKMDLSQMTIGGWVDGIEAVKQAVYKILNTQRYDFLIYSWSYGSALKELFGEQIPAVYSEMKERITHALLQDERISGVDDFFFASSRGEVLVQFTVNSVEGNFNIEKVVKI
ncbi:MAG: DUF2634 domain-containing protein [Ruminiclostridium sp.]